MTALSPATPTPSPDRFFDSGEYEVVGIYDVRPMTGSSTISEAAISVPWNTIYIPEKSLENAPAEEDRPVTGALLTIWLENGKIEPFIERMNELGITGAKQGDYEARFTFYDQGYSRIQPSLEALSGTAELLLILSSSLLVIAALLLAFFYAQSQKQSIGTMRLLGCSKARAFAAVMLSALIIAVTGALIGAAIGHALTASVGESIMANANQTPEEFLAFSAYLGRKHAGGGRVCARRRRKGEPAHLPCRAGVVHRRNARVRHTLSRQRAEGAAATGGRVKDYMPKRLPGRGAVERSETEGLR